jgi:hypothetical protein
MHDQRSLSMAGPLAVCGRLMEDYNILRSRLLSEKTAVDVH